MSTTQHIGLAGFSEFEKSVLEALFRLASRTQPHFQLIANPAQASVVILNGDNPASVAAFSAAKPARQHVVLVGKSDCGTGWPVLPRPIRLMGVLSAVNALVGSPAVPLASLASAPVAPMPTVSAPARVAVAPVAALPAIAVPAAAAAQVVARLADQLSDARVATGVAAPAMAAPVQAAFSAHRESVVAAPVQSPVRPAAAPLAPSASAKAAAAVRSGFGSGGNSRFGAASDFMGLGAATKPAELSKDSQFDDILVVDDSDIALKFMQNRLTRYGFRVQLVRSGEEALSQLGSHPFKFVFLDVMMEGLDGYQTCRAIKQRKYPEGKPPVVVMLTSRGGTIDKIRGTLAGCDAYLTKPLNETELVAVLAKHDQTIQRGFQETNFGAGSKDF